MFRIVAFTMLAGATVALIPCYVGCGSPDGGSGSDERQAGSPPSAVGSNGSESPSNDLLNEPDLAAVAPQDGATASAALNSALDNNWPEIVELAAQPDDDGEQLEIGWDPRHVGRDWPIVRDERTAKVRPPVRDTSAITVEVLHDGTYRIWDPPDRPLAEFGPLEFDSFDSMVEGLSKRGRWEMRGGIFVEFGTKAFIKGFSMARVRQVAVANRVNLYYNQLISGDAWYGVTLVYSASTDSAQPDEPNTVRDSPE